MGEGRPSLFLSCSVVSLLLFSWFFLAHTHRTRAFATAAAAAIFVLFVYTRSERAKRAQYKYFLGLNV